MVNGVPCGHKCRRRYINDSDAVHSAAGAERKNGMTEGNRKNSDELGSKTACRAAAMIAMSESREQENDMKEKLLGRGIKAAAVDFGGDFSTAVQKVLERTVVAAKREGIIADEHAEEGAAAGAAHEAVQQIINKCIGLNLGGKIGIARCGSHIAVCLFFAIGLLNLNDVVIGIGHRAV